MRKMFFLFCFLSVSVIFSQDNSSIRKMVDNYQNSKLLKNASWSVTARYLDNGEKIISYNSDLALAPASNMKLLTTSAAFDILGEDFKFVTKIYSDGEIDSSGNLNGNVYIVGGGDPTLGYDLVKGSLSLDDLMGQWVKAFKHMGIKYISGNIFADDLLYDRIPIPENWVWVDLGNYYAASASALTINNNLYFIYFKPSKKVGAIAELIRTEPKIENLKFKNLMRTGEKGSGDNGYVFNAPLQFNATLRGTIPQGKNEFSIKGSIPNPPLFAVQYLRSALIKNKISVGGKALIIDKKINYDRRKLITETYSPCLEDIIFIVNKRSDNLYTEMLLRAIGYKVKGEGSVKKGVEAVEEYFDKNKINRDGLYMYDGCGLSRSDAITTNIMVDLLTLITTKNYFPSLYNSLAVVGDPNDIGYFKNVGIGTEIEKNAHVKSGVIEKVRAYSGYLKNKSGRTIAFSMIANNFNGSGSAASTIHKNLMIALAKLK